MDWQMMSGLGSICCAAATFIAAFVALYIGLRGTAPKMSVRGIFIESKAYASVEDHPNCFSLQCVNTGSKPVYLSHALERAKFNRSIAGIKGFLRSVASKRRVSSRFVLPTIVKRAYWMAYSFNSIVEIAPGHSKQIDVPFKWIQDVQRERNELGLFNLEKPMRFYLVDISGRKYRVQTSATPSSFLEVRECRMVKVSVLTGDSAV